MIEHRIPLSKLEIVDQSLSPNKRRAKIFTKKLPEDFFQLRRAPLQSERSSINSDRNQIHTQNYQRKAPEIERISETRELSLRKGELSGRLMPDQSATLNLFMGIISSTREIRKSIRKHSLQLKKDSKFNCNIENIKLQLPPLVIKKGASTNF